MREIKFRAWENQGKFWYPAESMIDFFNFRSEEFAIVADQFNKDVFSLEQCTGLKDKNGKEIYEGDIVKFDYGDSTPAIIVYSEGAYFLQATDDNSLFLDPESDKPCPMGWFDTVGLEVIGNIHENPELLKEEE